MAQQTDEQQGQIPGTDDEKFPGVKFEGLTTQTATEFSLGDTVKFDGSGIISAVIDEKRKDGEVRRVYKVRPDGVNLA